jgi:hypothetical protein
MSVLLNENFRGSERETLDAGRIAGLLFLDQPQVLFMISQSIRITDARISLIGEIIIGARCEI